MRIEKSIFVWVEEKEENGCEIKCGIKGQDERKENEERTRSRGLYTANLSTIFHRAFGIQRIIDK